MLAEALGLIFDDDDPVWCDAREVLITGGVRAGKTTRNSFKTLCKSLDPSVRLIWVVGPDYVQAQEEFRYLLEWSIRLGLVEPGNWSTPAEGGRKMTTITGCVIETKSAQHTERLASVAPDLIVLCEPGQMSSEVYDTCLARLAERRGHLFMGGTLEDDDKPRWQWYEDLAVEWSTHVEGQRERSFTLPTWTNRAIYPLGLDDPELQVIRSKTSDYIWRRKYGGQPEGMQNPCFPLLWEPYASNDLLLFPEYDTNWVGGAIGVDYGRTFEHPSASVVLRQDDRDRVWVSAGWKGIRADPTVIESVVSAQKQNFDIWQGEVDPNQGYMGDRLGFAVAPGGPGSTEMRISLTNGLLENRRLYFDLNGPLVREVWSSMRSLRRIVTGRGKLVYERPLGDDLAQCVMYGVELLRSPMQLSGPLLIDAGRVQMRFQPLGGSKHEGNV